MTKKDYELIAKVISNIENEYEQPNGEFWSLGYMTYLVARQFAEELGNDNPRFDNETFMKACGYK